MAKYQIRLYKQTGPNPNKFQMVNNLDIEAQDDEEAITKAPHVQIPKWDNSDLAILYSPNEQSIWKLHKDDV